MTDAGLENLKALTELETLGLAGTQVTDAGLPYLKGLAKLLSLNLGHTKVTEEGVRKLKQGLPDCQISH